MKRPHAIAKVSAGFALAGLVWSTAASAQDATQTAPPLETTVATPTSTDPNVRPIVGERTTYSAPNSPLLIGGIFAFGGAYSTSVVVAAIVNTSFDNWLYIPVAGPWIDLAHRPQCGNGLLEPSCSSQFGRKAILVADGALQGVGVLAVAAGLILPGRHRELLTAKSDRPGKVHVNILPSQVGRDGYGLTALGDF
jgi:hypothetical protein